MHRTVLAFPTVPGKSDDDVKRMADQFRSRADEYREARGRAGITLEPAYLQRTPMDVFVVARRRGLAFLAPVMPGKADAGRQFATEAFDTRRDELAASRRSWGHNAEVVTLMSTPMGDLIAVYIEADDPVEGNRRFAESTASFDTWFKAQCAGIFPPQINFNEPLPPVEEMFDSETVGLAGERGGTPA